MLATAHLILWYWSLHHLKVWKVTILVWISMDWFEVRLGSYNGYMYYSYQRSYTMTILPRLKNSSTTCTSQSSHIIPHPSWNTRLPHPRQLSTHLDWQFENLTLTVNPCSPRRVALAGSQQMTRDQDFPVCWFVRGHRSLPLGVVKHPERWQICPTYSSYKYKINVLLV